METSSAKMLQTMSSALESLVHFIQYIDNSFETSSLNTMSLAIQHLVDLLEISPKKVAQNIDNLIYILEFCISHPNSTWLLDKAYFFDFLTMVVNKYPKLANGKNERGSKLFKIALDILTQTSNQVSDEWMNPPDGFTIQSQQDVDSRTVTQIMSSINEFAESIGFQATLTHLQPLFLEYIQKTEDWRYPYAALIVSSQISNEESVLQNLSLIVQWAISMTEHYHPKVKYAALQLIGQFSQDLKADFQEAYFNSLIPVTLKLLQDPIPRIVAHTFACMTNFFENCKQLWKIQSILGQFLNPIIHYIKTGNTWVKEAALSTLASFASIEDSFGPNISSVFQLCADIISGSLGKKQYKQVLNQSIQIISVLFASQKKQYVQPYLNHFITLMFSQKDQIGQSYLLQAWNRICSAYEQFLTDITEIYKILFETAKNLFEQMDSDQECITSLKCLNVTLNSFKSQAPKYAPETAAFAKEVFQTAGYQKTKEEALMLQIATITTTKPTNLALQLQDNERQRWLSQAYNKYQEIIHMIQEGLEEPDYQIQQIPCLFESVSQLISSFKQYCSDEKLITIVQKLFQLVNQIENACQDSTEKQTNWKDQNQEIESSQSQVSFEKLAQSSLQEALDGVLEILKDCVTACANTSTKMRIYELYKQQIQYSLQKGSLIVYFGLSLAVDILSVFGHEQIQGQYPKIIEFYSYYVENPCPKIRNMAVFGYNNVFSKLPSSFFSTDNIQKLLQLLLKSLNAGFSSGDQNQNNDYLIKHCKDNVISALGALLKHHGSAFPSILHQSIYQLWLSHLPLNDDKLQGDKQQQFLIQILSTFPALLINQAKDLLSICEIYAKFVTKRRDKQYKEIVEKTKQSLQMMSQWSLFKESASYLWNNLCESHKQTLTRMMSN